ncbi:MAG: DUF507 family protein [Terriglobales bacterium]
MRLSRDKVNQLSHVITGQLASHPEVHFAADRNDIRLEVRKILEQLLHAEEKMDQAVRQKISSQKRSILEGSEEWDILYRKYYLEELKTLGV